MEELLNRADAELGGSVRAGGSASINPPAGNIIRFKPVQSRRRENNNKMINNKRTPTPLLSGLIAFDHHWK